MKLFLNWGMVIILTVIALLKGNGESQAIIGVNRCDPVDWGLFGILHFLCFIFIIVGVKVVQDEY